MQNPYPLFQRYPRLALHRAPLCDLPTPIDHAVGLGRAIGVRSLYIKRDDRSATPYGGGKPRKLELFFGEAIAEHHPQVITFGAVGSHHALATAIYARKLGLNATLLLLPQPPSDEVRTTLLACAHHNASMELAGNMKTAERRAAALVAAAPAERKPYVIAVGGSSPLGNVGFVNAAFELSEQIDKGAMPRPDDVYMALGTSGSAVGLAVGLKAVGLPVRIVAVRASSPGTSSRRVIETMYRDTVAFLRDRDPSFPAVELEPDDLVIVGDYLGAGYGEHTVKGERAIALAAEHGVRLEHTYTAKAFAALIDRARREPDRVVLFWQSDAAQPAQIGDADVGSLPPELRPYAR